MHPARLPLALVAALVLALAAPPALRAQEGTGLSGALMDFLRGEEGGDKEKAVQADADQPRRVPFSREEMQLSFAPLVKETAPAVVNVYASATVQARSPFAGDPFFERFFGGQLPPRVQSSLGSGVIVDPSGIVVTNNHVVRGADEVKVALSDGTEFESEILLKDESLDLAVLKIEGDKPFPAAAIGNSDALQVGDLVLAIGNPFGVGQTTTSGIVSALARSHVGISDFGFFIQTDAAINPGNSGGALINMKGQVVGINTAIFSRSGGSIGIGFAIPSNMVRAFVDSARSGADHFQRPYFGADLEEVTPQIGEALGMDRPAGALVTNVAADSPAASAGVKPGDVIVAMNKLPIEHPDALEYRLATQPVDTDATMALLRSGERETVTVHLVRMPEGQEKPLTIGGDGPFAGARVADLSPALAHRFKLPVSEKGVAVVAVAPNSPARQLGLKPRDIVRNVNDTEITSAEELKRVAEAGSRWWRFAIERDGRILQQMLR